MALQQYGGEAERSLRSGILRGAARRCPNCGKTALFRGYGTVVETCPSCGQEHGLYRSDDAPAYATIFVVGHLVVPLMLMVYMRTNWETWVHISLWLPITLILTLLLLPPIKGGIIGLQWALDVRSDERR